MKKEENKNILTVKNKLTGYFSSCKISKDIATPRQAGLVVKEAIRKMAYELGCDIEDLEITNPPYQNYNNMLKENEFKCVSCGKIYTKEQAEQAREKIKDLLNQ